MDTYIRITPKDSVVVALTDIPKGTVIPENGGITVLSDIPAGHKIALVDINSNEPVIKYGASIGLAKEFIAKGSHVHIHNIGTGLGDLLNYTYSPVQAVTDGWAPAFTPTVKTFKGFEREDGRAGVRNEIWIIPTVGCVNSVATAIAAQAKSLISGTTVDDVIAFPHPYGCSQMGDDQEHTRTILADLVNHPNAGAVLVLGLGCENSNIDVLKPYIGEQPEGRVKYIVSMECEDEIAASLDAIRELVKYADKFKRKDIPVSKLVVGLKCGGSDGLSGITANPLVGRFSDLLIGNGGTTVLTEVPEMFGAETLLMNRCANEALFEKTVALINDFKNYFKSHNQTIYENPSPGNKKGGISTLEDKSLGCTQKSGTSPIRAVLAYGERIDTTGLNLLSAPGNDLVAATALAASGAQIILFTTGRGTPFAAPVPTVKISSNSRLAAKKSGWIDFNAGAAVEGKSLDALASELYEYVLKVAEGEQVCAERAGFHDMAIFKQGVTL